MCRPQFFIVVVAFAAIGLVSCGGSSGSGGTVVSAPYAPGVTLPGGLSTISLAPTGSSTVSVSEPNYNGTFAAVSSNTAVATVSQSAGQSGVAALKRRDATTATFTITAVGPGTATIVISDQNGHSSSIPVTVSGSTASPTSTPTATPNAPMPVASPNSISFGASGQQQNVTVSESGYSGTFSAFSSDPSVASVSPTSGAGSFTVVAGSTAGTATVTFADSNNHQAAVSVVVTLANGVISVTNVQREGAR